MSAPGTRRVRRSAPAAESEPLLDLFTRADLRLAVLFSVIVMVLVVAAGVLIDLTVNADLHDAIELKVVSEAAERQLVIDAIGRIRTRIIIIDSVVIVAVGALGVWYAQRTLRPIRDTYAAQKRFVSDAAHELRTPLAIVKADFDVALMDEGAGLEVAAVRRDLEEIERMGAMVSDLLLLSRIDARQEELRLAPLDLAALVRHGVEKLRPLAERRGVALTVTAPSGAVTVSGDAAHRGRALLNLVKNAIEHSPTGAEIRVAVRMSAGRVDVEVSDTGGGLTPEELPHIFDRFYRSDSARSLARGGSGLGLSIAQWVVHAHKGSIHAASVFGHGTTMTVSLPLS